MPCPNPPVISCKSCHAHLFASEFGTVKSDDNVQVLCCISETLQNNPVMKLALISFSSRAYFTVSMGYPWTMHSKLSDISIRLLFAYVL